MSGLVKAPGRARAATAAVLLGVLSLVLGACVSLPQEGAVRTRPGPEQVEQGGAPFDFTPSGPRRGAAPLDIVEDFLLAMQASPQSTAVARTYLTEEGEADWAPEQETLVYGSRVLTGANRNFEVRFADSVRLDDRGTWKGQVGGDAGVTYSLKLAKERGEWRIANPPDALLIPQSHFESRYQQYSVYFFDPTARVLVPEPVYLPRGEQAATLLVRRLLQGPDPALEGVLRTFIPQGTRYVLSVPVSSQGVAEVPLSEEMRQLGKDDLQMALAQVAWTLRQLPGLDSMRVTVDGSPLDIPGEGSPQSVGAWTEFDPSIHWASQELFGIREGRVLALATGGGQAAGQFGAQEYALGSLAVDLAAERMAGVTEDGTTVVLAPRARATAEAPPPSATRVVYQDGTDVLRPAWDFLGQIWLVDNRRRGARVHVVRDGVAVPVRAPGIAGERVTSFTVSRDGSRFVAVVEGASDRVVSARVLRNGAGRVLGLTQATSLPVSRTQADLARDIRDLGWRTPGTLALLTGPSPTSSQLRLLRVDGSPAVPDDDDAAEVLSERVDRLVVSPSPGMPTYLTTRQGLLVELTSEGAWVPSGLTEPLLAPAFVG